MILMIKLSLLKEDVFIKAIYVYNEYMTVKMDELLFFCFPNQFFYKK
jgi:hypothetical protein